MARAADRARLEAGDAKAAYDDLAQASRVAPESALAPRVFAAWDVDAGDFDTALRDLGARLHADPADALATFQRGRVWFYKCDAKWAFADFQIDYRSPKLVYPLLWQYIE